MLSSLLLLICGAWPAAAFLKDRFSGAFMLISLF